MPLRPPVLEAAHAFTLEDAVVMMIDDEPINIEMTEAFLEEAGFRHFCSTSDSTAALSAMRELRPHVVLLDIQMPEVDGFDILAAMRAEEGLRHLPVIVLTSATDPETKLRALELGAADFLAKPVDASELTLRLRNTLAARAYLDYMTHYDRLTSLPNRQRWMEEVERAMERSAHLGLNGAVLQIDIDRFKQINEALGPARGDELLRAVAAELRACAAAWCERTRGTPYAEPPVLARFNGDEFAVLLPAVCTSDCAADFSALVRERCARRYDIAGHEVGLTLSMGIAIFPGDAADANTLIQRAGTATHHAKQGGRNACRFYSPDLDARALQHLTLEADLQRAIERDELCLYYQPKVDAASARLLGAEALVRWIHPERGFLSPAQFIPVAESSGLIVPLGQWVLREACRQARAWRESGAQPLTISVNVSPQQFRQPGYVAAVREVVAEFGSGDGLCLELTESSMMDEPDSKIMLLQSLRELGFQLSIDDFGTGYSSLSYLRKFPLDELKIDKSFIDEVEHSADAAAITEAIIVMARSLGLSVVAEGVETQGQRAFLRERRCEVAQGYLFGKPVPATEFERRWLAPAPAGLATAAV